MAPTIARDPADTPADPTGNGEEQMSDQVYSMDNAADFVGKELGLSDWMAIAQTRIDGFADVTEDHQWIHQAGPEADAGPFGGPVAHGLLALGLTVKFAK